MLGEALELLGAAAVKILAVMTSAFMLALLLCFFMDVLRKDIGGRADPAKNRDVIAGISNKKIRWILLAIVFGCIGAGRGRLALQWQEREQNLKLDGKEVIVYGTVMEAEKSRDSLALILKDCVVAKAGEAGGGKAGEEKTGEKLKRLQVYLEDAVYSPKAGSMIQVKGRMKSFSGARNPGEFDRRAYYYSKKMSYRMYAKSWQEAGNGYSWFRERLYGLSVYAGNILDEIADPKDAGIFRAVLLGERTHLDKNIQDLYQKNGIAHLLAISGLHLSLISTAAYGMLRRAGAGYGRAGILGGLFLTAYAVMTKASPSVIRALVMALSGFLAAWLGRTYDLPSALSLAGILLLWDNPFYLCQSGVQLSFGAVSGICVMSEYLAGNEEKGTQKGKLLKGLKISAGMQLMTMPVVLYHFFQIPLYGIFLNLLVVPLMGIVVASGAAGIIAGSFSLTAGRFAAGSGHIILKLYDILCKIWECLPGSNLILGRPEVWQSAVYFGILGASLYRWKCRKIPSAGILAAAAVMSLLQMPVRGLEVVFLDVGQGDGICIRTKETTILVDGGSADQKNLGEDRLEPFLKSKGISRVDYAIISHGDQDHINGLVYLMEKSNIKIENLILPAAGRQDEIYGKLASLAANQGGSVGWMERGERLKEKELEILCLYPEEGGANQGNTDRNEHSLVLRADYGDFHMLLTGDMSGDGEKRLMELEKAENNARVSLGEVQVLKVAHHGSRYSTGKMWLETVSPMWAVISCGENNRYGHPGQEVLKNLAMNQVTVFETETSGAISMKTDGKRIWWNPWIP